MRCPVIVVTGPIGSGKTTMAKIIAGREGCLLMADPMAREVYEEPLLRAKLKKVFGVGVLTPSGKVSRKKLGRVVFSGTGRIAELNRLVKPFVKRLVSERIREKQKTEKYIVLDAVLFFEYKFRFKVDLVVLVDAPGSIRVNRMMKRDGISRENALARIERQDYLRTGWAIADVRIDASGSKKDTIMRTEEVRDLFLKEQGL
ncbi:MAG: dephospho-CoA kinase [Candidatus Krumholzibacteria bacterium]|nr:dephospho-CoA kinase [Candidatus Krumholzibacteria bacterium]